MLLTLVLWCVGTVAVAMFAIAVAKREQQKWWQPILHWLEYVRKSVDRSWSAILHDQQTEVEDTGPDDLMKVSYKWGSMIHFVILFLVTPVLLMLSYYLRKRVAVEYFTGGDNIKPTQFDFGSFVVELDAVKVVAFGFMLIEVVAGVTLSVANDRLRMIERKRLDEPKFGYHMMRALACLMILTFLVFEGILGVKRAQLELDTVDAIGTMLMVGISVGVPGAVVLVSYNLKREVAHVHKYLGTFFRYLIHVPFAAVSGLFHLLMAGFIYVFLLPALFLTGILSLAWENASGFVQGILRSREQKRKQKEAAEVQKMKVVWEAGVAAAAAAMKVQAAPEAIAPKPADDDDKWKPKMVRVKRNDAAPQPPLDPPQGPVMPMELKPSASTEVVTEPPRRQAGFRLTNNDSGKGKGESQKQDGSATPTDNSADEGEEELPDNVYLISDDGSRGPHEPPRAKSLEELIRRDISKARKEREAKG